MISFIKKIRQGSGFKLSIIIKLCKLINSFSSKFGINITVNHFYSPIPNIREIKKERIDKRCKFSPLSELRIIFI